MPSVMSETELTEAMITTAIANADARVCVANDRCVAVPHLLQEAPSDLHREGRVQGRLDRE
jgi:hypothetical protein